MKPMELVCNALEFSGNLYLCSMLPLPFRGLLTKGQACRKAGRKGEPVASIAIKESLGLLSHPTRQHDTLARGSWAESLGGLVFLAGGSKPRATAVREREELQTAEGAVQLALGKQVSREQAPGLGPRLPILWLEYVILQLLHTLGWLHLPCEGAMQASGRLPPPRLYLEGLPSLSFFPAPPSYVEKWAQALMTVNPTDKALPRVTTHPQMWAASQFQDSPCFFPAPTWSHLPLSLLLTQAGHSHTVGLLLTLSHSTGMVSCYKH